MKEEFKKKSAVATEVVAADALQSPAPVSSVWASFLEDASQGFMCYGLWGLVAAGVSWGTYKIWKNKNKNKKIL